MPALVNAINALPQDITNCRLDAQVDSHVVIDTFEGQGSRTSPELTAVCKKLFAVLSDRNLQLKLSYVPSANNEADAPSRVLSPLDSALSNKAWHVIEGAFGSAEVHTCDLMALDSNARKNRCGHPLPHFTPFASPESSSVNLFCQDLSVGDERFKNMYRVLPSPSLLMMPNVFELSNATMTIQLVSWGLSYNWDIGVVMRISRKRISSVPSLAVSPYEWRMCTNGCPFSKRSRGYYNQ